MQETEETQVRSLGWEDPLKEEMAILSSILVWRILWSLVGYSPWSCKELDMNEHIHRKEEEDMLRVKARRLQASLSLVSSLQSGIVQP